MRFLPFIGGKSFLVVYAVYAVLVIIIATRKLKNNNGYFTASNINEEKYYVMKYYYNVRHMFYYFTYKLYAKGVLLKDNTDGSFYINKDVTINLSNIEEQVCTVYLEKFIPKKFNDKLLNEKYFKEYYDNIYNKLIGEGLIKDFYMKRESKISFCIALIVLFIPGIWRIIGALDSGMPIALLVPEVMIILFIALFCLYPYVKGRLTNEGYASKGAYENYRKMMAKNRDIAESDNNELHADYMEDFLITNSWMIFLGVNSVGTDKDRVYINNDSGGSCSSCSSSDSGGSGSSCSSCGGCGGGD